MSLGPEARARLRARFLAGLPDRLAVMLAVEARLGAGELAAAEEARRLGHQFAGTGASFGFPALSERGQELEQASLDELPAALGRLIACVHATLQRPEPTLPTPRGDG